VFLDAGIYYGVDWSGGVLVGSNADLRTVVASAQTYLAGLGGGSIFLSLIGTHVFAPTLIVTVNGISFFGLGKSTVLQVNGASPARLFQVDANDVTFQNLAFDGNKAAYVSPGQIDGINVINDSIRTLIIGCYFYNFHNNNDHPIEVEYGSAATNVVVANCHFNNNDSYSIAFASAGGHCIVHGCVVIASAGVEAGGTGSYNIISNNIIRDYATAYSIRLNFAYNIAIGNTVTGMAQCSVIANDCSVIGNVFRQCVDQAILVSGVNDTLIVGNSIFDTTAAAEGVRADSNSQRTTILSNRIRCTYGVVIIDATVVDTIIFNNNFNGSTTPVAFGAGSPTIIVPTLTLPFVDGTLSVTADGAPKGWQINAAGNFAIAYGVMPPNCQQTLQIKVWAVGLAAPGVGNQMLIDLAANGAQPDEVYTGEAIAVNSKESNETNFDINDIITWTFRAFVPGGTIDDADIGHLVAGDCLEIKMIYRAAVAPDIATNALLRCVEIMYV
jgi:hypothetical protein